MEKVSAGQRTSIKRFLLQAPPELYFYFLIPLAALLAFKIHNPYLFERPEGDRALITMVLRDQFFSLSTIPLFIIYASFKLFVNVYRWLALQLEPSRDTSRGRIYLNEISSSFFLSLGFMFSWFVSGLVVVALETSASRLATIENSFYLMGLDYSLFGTYPPFVIQNYFNSFFADLTIRSYAELPSVIVLVFFITLFMNGVVFRKYLLNLVVALLPGFLFWYLLPGLSPEEMFRRNILEVPLSRLDNPQILSQFYQYPPLMDFLGRISDKWSNLEAGRLAITLIPSMHMAWGLIVCYYAIKAAPRTVWFFAPYCFFNSVGTVYTLQHFVVDLVPGVLVGGLSILFIERLVDWDLRRGCERGAYFSFIDAVPSDLRQLFRYPAALKRKRPDA